MIGQLLKNTYRIVSELGHGGMGTVYLAEHRTLPRRFAIKVLRVAAQPSAEALARFEREARIASSLGHPNIIGVLDFDWQPDGSPYLVMELLQGEDLAQRLARQGPMREAELLPVCRQICAGLAVAHAAGIVHRDLKPQNVFLHRFGGEAVVKLVDFGISKIGGDGTALTADHALMGTPHYMAPEQASGAAAQVDGRADLFSLGAILHECLTGTLAFGGTSLPEVIHAICYGDRPSLRAVRPETSERLDAAVQRLVARDRADRFPDVQAAWTDLAPALGGQATTLSTAAPAAPLEATLPGGAGPASGLEPTLATPAAAPAVAAEPPPAAPATATAAVAAVAPGRRGWRIGLALLGLLAVAGGSTLWLIRDRPPRATRPPPRDAGTALAGPITPDPRARIALLPPECEARPSGLVTALRESAPGTLPGVLVAADEIAAARGRSASGAISERALGQRLGAGLVVASRCAGERLKVRVISVHDDAVVASEDVALEPTAEQVQVLSALLMAERTAVLARRETRMDEAYRFFRSALGLARSGFDPTSFDALTAALRQAIRADPAWPRPRLLLAEALLYKYDLTADDALLTELGQQVEPLRERTGPHQAEALTYVGLARIWREEIAAGRQLLTRAQTLEATEPKVSLSIPLFTSLAAWLDGDFEAAATIAQRGAREGFALQQMNLSSFRMSLGQLDVALVEIDRAVAIQDRQHRLGDRDPDLRRGVPQVIGAHAQRGFILLLLGRAQDALAAFSAEQAQLGTRATFYNPVVIMQVQFGRAGAHRALGQEAEAASTLVKAREALEGMLRLIKNPNFSIYNMVGGILPWVPDALLDAALRRIRTDLPHASLAELLRAAGLHRRGRKADADAHLARTLASARPERRAALEVLYRTLIQALELAGRQQVSGLVKR